jgi:hypothetical protein
VSLTVVDLESEWRPLSKIAIVGIAMRSLRRTLRTNRTYQNEVFRRNKSKIIKVTVVIVYHVPPKEISNGSYYINFP